MPAFTVSVDVPECEIANDTEALRQEVKVGDVPGGEPLPGDFVLEYLPNASRVFQIRVGEVRASVADKFERPVPLVLFDNFPKPTTLTVRTGADAYTFEYRLDGETGAPLVDLGEGWHGETDVAMRTTAREAVQEPWEYAGPPLRFLTTAPGAALLMLVRRFHNPSTGRAFSAYGSRAYALVGMRLYLT